MRVLTEDSSRSGKEMTVASKQSFSARTSRVRPLLCPLSHFPTQASGAPLLLDAMAAAAARHLLNPLATPEQIVNTPSRADGISEELETDLRACQSDGLFGTNGGSAIGTDDIVVRHRWRSPHSAGWYPAAGPSGRHDHGGRPLPALLFRILLSQLWPEGGRRRPSLCDLRRPFIS